MASMDSRKRAAALILQQDAKRRAKEQKVNADKVKKRVDMKRWVMSSRVGDVFEISGARFLVSKAPMRETDYTIDQLKEKVTEKGLSMDILINLSPFNSDHLFNAKDALSIQFACEDDQEPSQQIFSAFSRTASNFFKNHKDKKKVIGVFSTYGQDIAGYMISRFVADVYEVDVKEALEKFSKFRPPGIQNPKLKKALFETFGYQDGNVFIPPPSRPKENRKRPRGSGHSTSTGGGGTRKYPGWGGGQGDILLVSDILDIFVFVMYGIHGLSKYLVRVKEPHLSRISGIVRSLVKSKWKEDTDANLHTCLNRVALSSSVMQTLKSPPHNSQRYHVTWWAEAPYGILVILKEGCFLFTKPRNTSDDSKHSKNTLLHIPKMRFMKRKAPKERLGSSLCLGEFVLDKSKKGVFPRFLVTDMLVMNKFWLGGWTHSNRLQCADKELVQPRKNHVSIIGQPAISLRLKPMYPAFKWKTVQTLNLSHKVKGLVFISREATDPGKGEESKAYPSVLIWSGEDSDEKFVSKEELEATFSDRS
ncbi:hypothetical protein AAMO2058_001194200 [Amorphochlora amoebiformis]